MARLRSETGQTQTGDCVAPLAFERGANLRYTSPPSLAARMSPIPIKSTRPKLKSATTTRLADMCGDFMGCGAIAQAKIGARHLSFEIAKQFKGSRVEGLRLRIAAARVDFDRSRSTC